MNTNKFYEKFGFDKEQKLSISDLNDVGFEVINRLDSKQSYESVGLINDFGDYLIVDVDENNIIINLSEFNEEFF